MNNGYDDSMRAMMHESKSNGTMRVLMVSHYE